MAVADKYGEGQDQYCYPDSSVLINLLDIIDEAALEDAEREISAINAQLIEFKAAPYQLHDLQFIHQQLFADIYPWAGQLRKIDISKQSTRFCTIDRIIPEANKLFKQLAQQRYFVNLNRQTLIKKIAELYADLNMLHPFREGNGRTQRILFEHLIVHCGYQISWEGISKTEWVQANINSVYCDFQALEKIFSHCIGDLIQ
jgi:cell filamentation protein